MQWVPNNLISAGFVVVNIVFAAAHLHANLRERHARRNQTTALEANTARKRQWVVSLYHREGRRADSLVLHYSSCTSDYKLANYESRSAEGSVGDSPPVFVYMGSHQGFLLSPSRAGGYGTFKT